MSWFEHGTSRIYYEISGEGDPVLVLPGLTDRIENHAALRERLAERYRVVAADLPGSGRSGPQPRDYPASYYEDDAQTFIALVAELCGSAPAHLIGFSDGGEVALLMASLAPTVAQSLITWGAAGVIHDPDGDIRNMFGNVIDNPSPDAMGFRSYLIATYGEDNARAMMKSAVAAFSAIVNAGGDISRSRVSAITCPVLLISGENDFLAPPALARDLATQIARVETVEGAGAGHLVHEDRPGWFLDTVLDWLAKHE